MMTHRLPGVQLWVWLSQNWSVFRERSLTRDATRRFSVHAAGRLHGCCCCPTDLLSYCDSGAENAALFW